MDSHCCRDCVWFAKHLYRPSMYPEDVYLWLHTDRCRKMMFNGISTPFVAADDSACGEFAPKEKEKE